MGQLHKSAIGLGSNWCPDIVSSRLLIDQTVASLRQQNINILAISAFYQTEPFPANGDPDFVNAVVLVETDLSPGAVLDVLHTIENDMGRTRTHRWEQRLIDIDLLYYGDQILPDLATQTHWQDLPLSDQMTSAPDQLILPHPRIQDRPFVLIPLRDVAPNWMHPVLNKSVTDMCASLDPAEIAKVVALD